jgi:hypothetical protein
MDTRVVADIEATEEDRSENLLLLGWDNALLGGDGPARPFERGSDGIRFLGIQHVDPDADLLFFSRSPFRPDRFLLFWSRIDPERDRFSVLPRIGSDWAVYDEFLPVRQGMFLPGTTWPPERDDRAEANHQPELLAERSRLQVRKTDHYDISAIPEEFSADELERIASARERAFSSATTYLGQPPPGFRISLFLYPDTENKKRRTGVPDPTHSAPWNRELHMIRSVALSASPHEEAHLLARQRYGPCSVTAIYEGLAIDAEDRVKGLPLEVASALLVEADAFPSLAAILDEESFRAFPDRVAPPAAGMLARWMRLSAPPERLAEAYRLWRGDPAGLAAALGRDPGAVENDFRTWVAGRAAARAADVGFHHAEAEAQEAYLAADWAGMIAALGKALTHRPDDPQTLFNLASAQMRSEALDGAETTLRRLLALPLDASQSRFRAYGHYQLGRVLDLAGRRREALEEYRAVLALPDESGSHLLAEERIRAPATREQLQ